MGKRRITLGHRGGAPSHHDAGELSIDDFRELVRELEVEEDPDDPDEEHTQVFVTDETSLWSISVQKSGRVGFRNVDDYTTPALYLRDVPWETLGPLFVALAAGRLDEVRAAGWMPEGSLPPWRKDYYGS